MLEAAYSLAQSYTGQTSSIYAPLLVLATFQENSHLLRAVAACRQGQVHDLTLSVQAARRGLAGMPAAAQLLTPSPYLDTRCWQYDSRHVTPLLRHRPYNEQPLRFASTTHPHEVKFKLQLPEPPAPPAQAPAGRQPKSMTVCHFHPSQPFVLCTLQTYGSAPQMCVYYRA